MLLKSAAVAALMVVAAYAAPPQSQPGVAAPRAAAPKPPVSAAPRPSPAAPKPPTPPTATRGILPEHRGRTVGTNLAACQGVRLRKEIRDLSDDERRRFLRAMRQLLESGALDDMVKVHSHLEGGLWYQVHGTPMFLPWHRAYLRELEDRLRAHMKDDTFAFPYWDWSLDSQNLQKSIIFSEEYFGSSDASQGYAVSTGPFKGMTVNIPQKHVLKRNSNAEKMGVFDSSAQILEQIKAHDTFSKMVMWLENGPHARIHKHVGGHKSVGGDLASPFSPNDPIFWLHHSFIDKIWFNWQAAHKAIHSFEASSYAKQEHKSMGMQSVVPRYNVAVSSLLDSRNICVLYANPGEQALKLRTDTQESLKNIEKPSEVDDEWFKMNGVSQETIKEVRKEETEVFKQVETRVEKGEDITQVTLPGSPPPNVTSLHRKTENKPEATPESQKNSESSAVGMTMHSVMTLVALAATVLSL